MPTGTHIDGLIIVTNEVRFGWNEDPVWITDGGSLGSHHETETTTLQGYEVEAQDPDNFPDTITYSVVAGALPDGASLNASTGAITGAAFSVALDTIFNFTVRAFDGARGVNRDFSITVENNTLPVFTTGSDLGTRD